MSGIDASSMSSSVLNGWLAGSKTIVTIVRRRSGFSGRHGAERLPALERRVCTKETVCAAVDLRS